MRRLSALLPMLLMVFGWSSTLKAQTRVYGSFEAANDEGLGYNLPVVDFGGGLDQGFGNRFELDSFGAYAVAHKAVIDSGQELVISETPIFWAAHHFGVTGQIRYTHLWTSKYSKGTYLPTLGIPASYLPSLASFTYAPGVVFRATLAGIPSRLWVDYVIPTGTINAATGIESNRLSGLEGTWEASMWNMGPFTLRLTINPAYYHGYSQGDPVCDGTYGGPVTCPRASWNTYAVALGAKFVFPRDSKTKVW